MAEIERSQEGVRGARSTAEGVPDNAPEGRGPAWELSNNGVPWRFATTGIWQLPFGKGKRLASSGLGNAVLGGWQISGAYENQPGPLLNWGSLFYNGDPNTICGGWSQTLDAWFKPDGFVTIPA